MASLKVFAALVCSVLLLGLIGCEASSPSSTPVPSVTATVRPQPTSAVTLNETELRYALFTRFGETFYCDPDFYPVARKDEMELALEKFPEMQKETEKFQAILKQLKLDRVREFIDAQKLAIYREYKRLNSILLEPDAGHFKFTLNISEGNNEGKGKSIQGTISKTGAIQVTKEEPAFLTCPICLAKGTLIVTPDGHTAVESLEAGAPVWTVDRNGNRVPGTILRTSRTPVPAGHRVVHIVLDDGRELYASPNHPSADGRTLGDIVVGDELNGASVISATLVDYTHEYTYDILPSGDTGLYWANGILVRSTLQR